jgi:putative chitinase
MSSPAELASFMGNAYIETARFTMMHEKFNYTSVEKIEQASASSTRRFTREQIQAAVDSRDPEQIATVLYEGRDKKDLGNSEVGDGWRFHGRGYFQFTGRYNYKTHGDRLGIDLTADPEIAADPEVSAKLALAYWSKVPEKEREDPVAAGIIINGGKHSAERRLAAAREWAAIITPELIRDLQSGALTLEQLAVMETDQSQPLQPGKRQDIRKLQTSLNRLGYSDAEGRALTTDGDYGRRTRLVVRDFQRDHGLVADGIAGQLTIAAVHSAVETELRSIGQPDAPYLQSREPDEALSAYRSLTPEPAPRSPLLPPPRLDDPGHRDHDLYQEARTHVHDLDRRHERQTDQYSDNLSAALVVAARSHGLSRIDRIELSDDASQLSAIETSLGGPDKRTDLPVMASMQTPLARSSDQWRDVMDEFERREEMSREHAQEMSREPQRGWNPPSHATTVASDHGREDPRHPGNPTHELYNELQRQVPQASEDRLVQFTAACHTNRITAANLKSVRLDEDRMVLEFQGAGWLTTPARIDLSAPPTYPQEVIAQIQQFDRHEMQIKENFQMQQAQMSMGRSL